MKPTSFSWWVLHSVEDVLKEMEQTTGLPVKNIVVACGELLVMGMFILLIDKKLKKSI